MFWHETTARATSHPCLGPLSNARKKLAFVLLLLRFFLLPNWGLFWVPDIIDPQACFDASHMLSFGKTVSLSKAPGMVVNIIMSSASLRTGESWIPVCLSQYNDKAHCLKQFASVANMNLCFQGFAYAYISFIEGPAGLV